MSQRLSCRDIVISPQPPPSFASANPWRPTQRECVLGGAGSGGPRARELRPDAHAALEIPGTGVEPQPRGDLDAFRSARTQKLDTRRQPTGRAEVGSDFFGGGDLS